MNKYLLLIPLMAGLFCSCAESPVLMRKKLDSKNPTSYIFDVSVDEMTGILNKEFVNRYDLPETICMEYCEPGRNDCDIPDSISFPLVEKIYMIGGFSRIPFSKEYFSTKGEPLTYNAE